MGQHGGHDFGKAGYGGGIVSLHQPVDAMAAGGQDYLLFIFMNDFLIPLFYDCRADCGFLRAGKAEF
jgi:hypothetical protein